MPYISKSDRDRLEESMDAVDALAVELENAGQLNYVLSQIIWRYLMDIKTDVGTLHYVDYNEVVGVLECLKLEIYRRLVAPYESEKIDENGDVFIEPMSTLVDNSTLPWGGRAIDNPKTEMGESGS